MLRYLETGKGLGRDRIDRGQDAGPLHDHDHRLDLGTRVFGRYLFAPAFFWEDVVSMLVLALHTAYLVALFSGAVDAERQMLLALAAYAPTWSTRPSSC